MRPTLFIGSSSESKEVAYALQENLERAGVCEPVVWDQDIFRPSRSAIETLFDTMLEKDFSVFLFIPDDIINKRGEQFDAIRDNVIFELGLFMGALGRNRCFMLEPTHCRNLSMPSDLAGITAISFESDRSDGNLIAALGPAANKICREIQKLGSRRSSIDDSSEWPRLLDNEMTWTNVEEGVSHFVEKAKEFNPCVIVGVNRGGAIVGNMVAKKLGQKVVYSVRTAGYREPHDQKIDKELIERADKPKYILVFDDVADSEEELLEARQLLEVCFPDSVITMCVLLKLPTRTWRGCNIDAVGFKSNAVISPPWDYGRKIPKI